MTGVDDDAATEDQNDPEVNDDPDARDEFAVDEDELDATDDEIILGDDLDAADDPDTDLDADPAAGEGIDIESVVEKELSSQERSARSLEIRRALEERREQRKLSEDLDYLDLDIDD